MRTRIKICGITRGVDALEAARLGADAIGLVFWSGSPRAVSAEQANEAIRHLPPFVTVVGLFVDPHWGHVRAILDAVPLDLLQFHGQESPSLCTAFGRRYIKAIRMQEGTDLGQEIRQHAEAAGFLLDTYVAGVPGGTGVPFDWSRIDRVFDRPLILAGGLNADNVAKAIGRVQPYGVDVSGGVEITKGIKDAAKMAAFVRGVNSVA